MQEDSRPRPLAHVSDDVLMGFAKDPTVPTGVDLPLTPRVGFTHAEVIPLDAERNPPFPYMMPEAGSQEAILDAVAGKRSDSRMIVTALIRGEMSTVVVRVEDSGEYFEFSVKQARAFADQIRKMSNYTERMIVKERKARVAAGLTITGRKIPGGGVGSWKATKKYRHH